MSSPFPGMNPYLEAPAIWSSFHTRLLVAIADTLAPVLQPNYYIEVETRTYIDDEVGPEEHGEEDELLVGIPDAAVLRATSLSKDTAESTLLTQDRPQAMPQSILLPMPVPLKQRYLEIREIGTEAVITIIEVLSPKNKRRGKGRVAYERKRSRILASLSHLVELDLLRANPPMAMLGQIQPTHYRIVVSRSDARPQAELYGFNLIDLIPCFPLPLKSGEPEPLVDLQSIIAGVCDRAGYHQRLDYRQPVPPPALAEVDQQWLDALLEPFRSG